MPSVTALVCAFDYECYVAEAIESALAQDYAGEIEVLVVDDGSTDGTAEVLRGFGDRIRVVRQENAGLNAATARGIAEATGDLIALLDADDAWRPDKLRRQVEVLVARPEVGLVYSDKEMVDADGRRLHPSFFAHHGIEPVRGHAVGPLLRNNVVPAPTIVFRRSLAEHVLPFPAEVAAQDWWLAVRIAAVAELDCVALPLTRYRVHGANMGVGAGGDEHFARLVRRDNAFRRWMLRHLDLGAASDADLVAAWQAVVKGVAFVTQELGIAAADQLAVAEADRADAGRLRAAAEAAPDPASAARMLVAACAADPLDAGATAALAELLIAPAEPAEPAEPAAPPAPGDAAARVDWAEERFGAGDADAALAALLAVAAAPNPPGLLARAHADIAVIAYSLGELAPAREAAMAALSHDAAHAGALEVLAGCAEAEGDLPAAAHWLRRTAAAEPGGAEVRLSLARCEYARGRVAAADALLREAAAIAPLPPAAEELQQAARRRIAASADPPTSLAGRALLVVDVLHSEPDAGGHRAETLGEALAAAGWTVEIACRAGVQRRSRHRGMTVHPLSGNTAQALGQVVRRGRHDAVLAISAANAWPLPATLMLPAGPRVVVLGLLDAETDAWLRGSAQALGEYRQLLDRADAVGVESLGGLDARLHADLGVAVVHLPPLLHGDARDDDVVVAGDRGLGPVIAAMSAGVPWVAGLAAREHSGGLAVPDAAVADALAHLRADEQARERLGAAGRAHWEAGLGGDALAARFDVVLRGAAVLPDVAAPQDAAAATDAALGAFLDARAVPNPTPLLQESAR